MLPYYLFILEICIFLNIYDVLIILDVHLRVMKKLYFYWIYINLFYFLIRIYISI